jgi:hypothetical protein
MPEEKHDVVVLSRGEGKLPGFPEPAIVRMGIPDLRERGMACRAPSGYAVCVASKRATASIKRAWLCAVSSSRARSSLRAVRYRIPTVTASVPTTV